jgi:ribosomal protein S18 acetylase RimI-like enzyme
VTGPALTAADSPLDTDLTPLDGYGWRPASVDDVPSLEALQTIANGGDLATQERIHFRHLIVPTPGRHVSTRCLLDPAGQVMGFAAAAIYVMEGEPRGDLECLVHPSLRGQGAESRLLAWAEEHARTVLAGTPGDRPAVLRIAFTDRRESALSLYESRGFRRTLATDTMRRDLRAPIPDCHVPEGFTLHPWNIDWTTPVHQIYRAAFGSRSHLRLWPEETWRRIFIESPAFRPDLSRVMVHAADVVGYVLSWVEPAGTVGGEFPGAWGVHAGILPALQNRGLGSGLINTVLHAIRAEGFDEYFLEVDVENRAACRLHQRLGFRTVARLQVYTKMVGAP